MNVTIIILTMPDFSLKMHQIAISAGAPPQTSLGKGREKEGGEGNRRRGEGEKGKRREGGKRAKGGEG